MRLLLVRHGETDWNAAGRIQGCTDTPLNARGRAQALALAGRLRDERPQRLYTSPLRRKNLPYRLLSSTSAGSEADSDSISPGSR